MKLHLFDGGDAITNFNRNELHIYEQAIAEHGDKTLYISEEGIYPCDGPSLCGGGADLSEFWCIFDRIKKEKTK